jgi:murein DD-endopeptidase MepM/ murein hydrolase activator NlpD
MLVIAAVSSRQVTILPDGSVVLQVPDVPGVPALPGQGVTATPNYPQPLETAKSPDAELITRDFAAAPGVAASDVRQSERGILRHIVQPGDTIFGIALQYALMPESVLWSNYGTLKDNPDLLQIGQELAIPPSNGLVYVVEPGDTVESVARRFRVEAAAIAAEGVNGLSGVNQALQPEQALFVPGGEREVVVWQLPKPVAVRTTARGAKVYRVGSCGEMEIPALGAGDFGFPTNRRYLSGYNFGPSHGGWDLAGRLGEPIYASDGGTVVYAGYSLDSSGRPRGYGQYVVLDHGNGYRTLYAHASQLFVRCGQQVARGTVIAAVGSVGKSTGPHLHFEIRLGDNYVSPAQFMTLQAR